MGGSFGARWRMSSVAVSWWVLEARTGVSRSVGSGCAGLRNKMHVVCHALGWWAILGKRRPGESAACFLGGRPRDGVRRFFILWQSPWDVRRLGCPLGQRLRGSWPRSCQVEGKLWGSEWVLWSNCCSGRCSYTKPSAVSQIPSRRCRHKKLPSASLTTHSSRPAAAAQIRPRCRQRLVRQASHRRAPAMQRRSRRLMKSTAGRRFVWQGFFAQFTSARKASPSRCRTGQVFAELLKHVSFAQFTPTWRSGWWLRVSRPSRLWNKFSSSGSLVCGGRWSTALASFVGVVAIGKPSGFAWSDDADMLGGEVQDDQQGAPNDKKSVNLDMSEEAIKSKLFWAWAIMVVKVGSALAAQTGPTTKVHRDTTGRAYSCRNTT